MLRIPNQEALYHNTGMAWKRSGISNEFYIFNKRGLKVRKLSNILILKNVSGFVTISA